MIEAERIAYWKKHNVYKSKNYTFSIDSPPPSVSGEPHMGTAFGYILKDIIARYKRIFGEKVFYPLGLDDNGIPTEKLIEKKIGKKLKSLPRDEVSKVCFDILHLEENKFDDFFIKMGFSHDVDLKYSTIGEDSTKIAQDSFIDLYNKGLIYRSKTPIIWDIVDQTALAQTDVEDMEADSYMHHIKFKCEEEDVVIATTRPEMLPAIVAVFYHPDDSRYWHLKGKKITTPLFNTTVELMSDFKVDMNKGSGLVMCCTFGDTTDIYWWKVYKLLTKTLLNINGTISEDILSYTNNSSLAKEMIGMSIVNARKFIVEKLQDYIVKSDKIQHTVKISERSKVPVEYLISSQWMLNIMTFKDELKRQADQVNWYPVHSKNKIYAWIDNLSWDWCLSRQRPFGVRIPVWYVKNSDQIILAKKTPVDTFTEYPEGYNKSEVILNDEVFDTWWTSSLTPQINNKDLFLEKPMSLRTQGHEIIRTWAFYTIVKAYFHSGMIPWENIFVHGWCLAEDRSKMSKSKGNIISPMDIMKQYGVDAMRYWAATSSFGQDTSFSVNTIKVGQKIINKILNAAKFISNFNFTNSDIINEVDLWIVTKANDLRKNVEYLINNGFNYSKAREEIDRFFMEIFCDQYIEIVKSRAYNDKEKFSTKDSESAISALYYVLQVCLLAYSPIIPFMTDHVWMNVLKNKFCIHIEGAWHKITNVAIATIYNEHDIVNMLEVINDIRKEKTLKQLALNYLVDTIEVKYNFSEDILKDLQAVLKCNKIVSGDRNIILKT